MLLITLPAELVSVCEVFSLKIFLLRRNFANFLSAFFVLVQARVHNRKEQSRQHPKHFPTSRRQHPKHFPTSPLGQYYAGSSPLNFGGRKRSDAFGEIWPSATDRLDQHLCTLLAKVHAGIALTS